MNKDDFAQLYYVDDVDNGYTNDELYMTVYLVKRNARNRTIETIEILADDFWKFIEDNEMNIFAEWPEGHVSEPAISDYVMDKEDYLNSHYVNGDIVKYLLIHDDLLDEKLG